MDAQSSDQLRRKRCAPCEGGVEPYDADAARTQLESVPDWRATHDGKRIRRDWVVRNFMLGMELFNAVAALAEEEGHHPDLHLENYRNVSIELWTHAIGGLSENDFILAAKIDSLADRILE